MKNICGKLFVIIVLATSCVSTKKYDLLVQSMQKSSIEKQQLTDSLLLSKKIASETIQKKNMEIALKNKQLDSLQKKNADLQTSYIDLEKNVFMQNLDFQKNNQNYKTQLAQRDTLLRQIISQSKELITENQRLTDEVSNFRSLNPPATIAPSKDSLSMARLDTLASKVYKQIKHFVGKELSFQRQGNKIQIGLAHQLLFQQEKLSEDGKFVLSIIAKTLKNEADTEITILNYANQDAAEKDKWETGMYQFLEVVRALNSGGIKDSQFRRVDMNTPTLSMAEVGVTINRLEILVGVK